MRMHRLVFVLSCALLSACGGDKSGANGAEGEDGLPKPAAASGSVTGMPDPGVADARPSTSASRQPDIVELPKPVDAGEIPPVDPDPAVQPAAEPAPAALPEPAQAQEPSAPATPQPVPVPEA